MDGSAAHQPEQEHTFDPFDAALRVRDALGSCSCCPDETEDRERWEAAHELLAWVTRAAQRIAVLEALTSPAAAAEHRRPRTNAERQAAWRKAHAPPKNRVTKRNENSNGNRNEPVTRPGTQQPSGASDPETSTSGNSRSSSAPKILSIKRETQSARVTGTRNGERDESVTQDAPDSFADQLERERPGIDGGSIAEAVAQAILAATGRAWPSDAWLSALSWIAVQPLAEFEAAMRALDADRATDTWIAQGKCTPAHIKKMWAKYSLGPQVSPEQAKASAEERADTIRRARVDLNTARMGVQQTDGAEREHYEKVAKRAEERLRSLGAQP